MTAPWLLDVAAFTWGLAAALIPHVFVLHHLNQLDRPTDRRTQ